jgi:RNA polymerase primary sigma factor
MYALLEQSNERPPSAEEIAKELDMTVNDVKESMKTLVVTYQWMHLLKEKILTFMTYCVQVSQTHRELIHESLRTEIERLLKH